MKHRLTKQLNDVKKSSARAGVAERLRAAQRDPHYREAIDAVLQLLVEAFDPSLESDACHILAELQKYEAMLLRLSLLKLAAPPRPELQVREHEGFIFHRDSNDAPWELDGVGQVLSD